MLVFPAVVFLFAVASYAVLFPHAKWSGDSYVYGVRSLMYHGVPYAQARTTAQKFFMTVPYAQDPGHRKLLQQPIPVNWNLFKPRIVYPWLASLLFSKFGFQSLHIVSGAAYVCTLVILYFLLLEFATPWASALLTFAFGSVTVVKDVAEAALTDMLATAFVALSILCMVWFLKKGGGFWLAAFLVACGLLTFSRPIPYVLLAGAAVPLVVAILTGNAAMARRAGALGAIAFAWCVVIVVVGAYDRAPGFIALLRQAEAYEGFPASTPLASFFLRHAPQLIGFLIYTLLSWSCQFSQYGQWCSTGAIIVRS